MRNWRSSLFWVFLAVIAVEGVFALTLELRDRGVPKSAHGRLAATRQPTPIAAPKIVANATPQVTVDVTRRPAIATSTASDRATTAPRIVVFADASRFACEGRWERIAGRFDGRAGGRSIRTFSHGARATLSFRGRFVRLYGVLGPGGGFGNVQLDGRAGKIVDFFAASKTAHHLLYTSPELKPGPHRLTVAVVPDPRIADARTQYVNIEGAEYGS